MKALEDYYGIPKKTVFPGMSDIASFQYNPYKTFRIVEFPTCSSMVSDIGGCTFWRINYHQRLVTPERLPFQVMVQLSSGPAGKACTWDACSAPDKRIDELSFLILCY